MEPEILNTIITRKVLFEKYDRLQAAEEIFIKELSMCGIKSKVINNISFETIFHINNLVRFKIIKDFGGTKGSDWFDINFSVLTKMNMDFNTNTSNFIKMLIKKHLNLDNHKIYDRNSNETC